MQPNQYSFIQKIINYFLERLFQKQSVKNIVQSAIFEMLPFSLPIILWAFATGIAMGDILPVHLGILMALLAYAGSAQIIVLPLILINAPLSLMVFAAFIVNIRFIIFSASLFPYLQHLKFYQRLFLGYINGDFINMSYYKKFPKPATTKSQKLKQVYFYTGASFFNYLIWQFFNIAGVVLAQYVPKSWNLGFVGTLALVPVILPILLEKKVYALITLSSIGLALIYHDLPYRLPLLIATFFGIGIYLCYQKIYSN
jgi:predicted branched-subunit amino acid permease